MRITQEIIDDFRRFMPAFTDPEKWGDDAIFMQLTEAHAMTGGSGWGTFDIEEDTNLKKRGMYYLTAHYLVSFYGSEAADPSNIKPEARLNVASKTIGDMSLSYRITEMEPTTTDFISTTIYGVRFLELRGIASCSAICV